MTSNDVITALQAQNAQVSAGQFGGTPSSQGQQLNATITARTLLQTPEQFDAHYSAYKPGWFNGSVEGCGREQDRH
jgi:multidrug efflux pump subunit AcrB